MGKQAGTTRKTGSTGGTNTGGINQTNAPVSNGSATTPTQQDNRTRIESVARMIKSLKAPSMGGSTTINLQNGREVVVSLQRPGYGNGGVFAYRVIENGQTIFNGRSRFGSNGYADFSTKTQAWNNVKKDIELYNS